MLSAQLSAFLTPEDLEATLSTLRKIFDNIIQHPNDDKYRQIKLANKTFSSKVWRYPACEELMKMSGWVVEDDHVRLRDDSQIQTVYSAICGAHVSIADSELLSAAMEPYSVMDIINHVFVLITVNYIHIMGYATRFFC